MTLSEHLANILTLLLVIGLLAVPVCLGLCALGRAVARKQAQPVEPDNCGDQGGLPAGAWNRSATLRPWKED